jgi:ketosteroid isomerase-like protein
MTDLAAIEARLRRVEDELAIRRILADYAAFLDGRDWAGYTGLFTADGEWTNANGSHKGAVEIRRMLEEIVAPDGTSNRTEYHIVSNPRIDLDGDRAAAVSRYLFVMRGFDGGPVPSLAGVYRDEFARQGGGWKIKRRVAEEIMPTSAEWWKIFHPGSPEQ